MVQCVRRDLLSLLVTLENSASQIRNLPTRRAEQYTRLHGRFYPSNRSCSPAVACSLLLLWNFDTNLSHNLPNRPNVCSNNQLRALQTACNLVSILSGLVRCSVSITTLSAMMVITIPATPMLEVRRNIITICRRAACSTDEPPRMAPDIVPGMAMMPITLLTNKGSSRSVATGDELASCC